MINSSVYCTRSFIFFVGIIDYGVVMDYDADTILNLLKQKECRT